MGAVKSTLATTCQCCVSREDHPDDVVPIDTIVSAEQDAGNGIAQSLVASRSRASWQQSQRHGGQAPVRRPSNRWQAKDRKGVQFDEPPVLNSSRSATQHDEKAPCEDPSRSVTQHEKKAKCENPTSGNVDVQKREDGSGMRSSELHSSSEMHATHDDNDNHCSASETCAVDTQIRKREDGSFSPRVQDSRVTDGGSKEARTDEDLANELSEALELFRRTDLAGKASLVAGSEQDADVMEFFKMLEALESEDVLPQSPASFSTGLDDDRDTSLSVLSVAKSNESSPNSPRQSLMSHSTTFTWEADEVRSRLRNTATLYKPRRKSAEKPNEIAMARAKLRSPQISARGNSCKVAENQDVKDSPTSDRLIMMLRSRPELLKHLTAKVADLPKH